MVPVGDARQDDPFEVFEDSSEVFSDLWSAGRERVSDRAGLDSCEDRIANGIRQVVGDPVGDAMRLAPKVLRIQLATALSRRRC
jgi:hypothetical protein